VPRGASYGAKREVIVQGDADFRPTGMAVAPDGSLYFADWVLRDYPVHGHGRLWRLSLPPAELKKALPPRSKEDLAASENAGDPAQNIESADPFVHAHGVWQLAQKKQHKNLSASSPRARLAALEVAWHDRPADVKALLRSALQDESPEVRLFAVRWISDERMTDLRDDVATLLEGPQPNSQLYLALLGAVDWLGREPSHRGVDFNDELLVRELKNEKRSPEARALALSLLNPSDKYLTVERLKEYLSSSQNPLRLEAVRSLAEQSNSERFTLLAEVAQDETQPMGVRAEAVAGIAAAPDKTLLVLNKIAAGDEPVLKREAARALRLLDSRAASAESKPPASDVAAWQQLTATPGDAASGRRLFFSPVGPRCSLCHTFAGRGGKVGPDLTKIASSSNRKKIITSILQPSQEIAPDYQPWSLVTTDGKAYTALRLPKPGDDGKENYIDSNGKTFTLASAEIEERHASDKSIMPDNLQATLSIEDLRDLITFLMPTSSQN